MNQPDPTTDRRARYATPLYALMRQNGWDGERTEPVVREMDLVLDAVLAVADAEQAELRTENADRLEHIEGALSRIRDKAEVTQVRVGRVLAFAEQVAATSGPGVASAVQAVIDQLRAVVDGEQPPAARVVPPAPTSRAVDGSEDRCAECGHFRGAHEEAEEPVSVGRCTVCADDEEWHDFEATDDPNRLAAEEQPQLQPDFTSPLAGRIEVRDPCLWCGDRQLIPRSQMVEHVARVHPDVRTSSPYAVGGELTVKQGERLNVEWGSAAEEQPDNETRDTLPEWLYQRWASKRGEPAWSELDEDDRSYWEHEASAVRRAVARNGFKQPTAPPAVVPQPEEA